MAIIEQRGKQRNKGLGWGREQMGSTKTKHISINVKPKIKNYIYEGDIRRFNS